MEKKVDKCWRNGSLAAMILLTAYHDGMIAGASLVAGIQVLIAVFFAAIFFRSGK